MMREKGLEYFAIPLSLLFCFFTMLLSLKRESDFSALPEFLAVG